MAGATACSARGDGPRIAQRSIWRREPTRTLDRPDARRRAGRRGRRSGGGVGQRAAARGVAQLGERAGLELADPLAGEPEVAADVVEGAGLTVEEAEPQLEDDPLPLRQAGDDVEQLLAGEALGGDLHRVVGVAVLDEVAELGVAVLADGGLERRGGAGVGEELLDGVDVLTELLGELLDGRLAAQLLGEV